MPVLRDTTIARLAAAGMITPYDPARVQPASYDLTLQMKKPDDVRQVSGLAWAHGETIKAGYGAVFLATTIERVEMPADVAGEIKSKSSLARQGLDHFTAGWIDPGDCGQITLEFVAHAAIELHHGQPIVQIVFHKLDEPAAKPYNGRYMNQVGTTGARKGKSNEK